jgi:hypothetical protein
MTLSQERVILPEKRIAMKLPEETDGGTSCPIRESYFYNQTYSRTSRTTCSFEVGCYVQRPCKLYLGMLWIEPSPEWMMHIH